MATTFIDPRYWDTISDKPLGQGQTDGSASQEEVESDAPRSIRSVFDETIRNIPDDNATIGDVVSGVGRRSTDILILVSTITAGVIIQLPVLPSLFAVPIMYLAFNQMMGNKKPYLFGAEKIGIDGRAVKEGLEYARWEMENVEEVYNSTKEKFGRAAKERGINIKLPNLPSVPGGRDLHDRLQGGLALALGAMIMSPIPLTHTVPAIGLIMLSMGRLTNNRAMVAAGVGYSGLVGIPVSAYATYRSYGAVQNFFENPMEVVSNLGASDLAIAAAGLGAAYLGYRYVKHRWGKFKETQNDGPKPAGV